MEQVRPGDEFILEGPENTVRYEVKRIDIVDPDKTAIDPAGNPDGLMLVTCYPFGTIDAGNNDYRLVVDAVTSSPSNI
jgi:sortase A